MGRGRRCVIEKIRRTLKYTHVIRGHPLAHPLHPCSVHKLPAQCTNCELSGSGALVPGDPVEVMLGESARPADREALRVSLGLDRPLLSQFGQYLGNVLRFDLGTSLHSQRPITDILLERIPATLELALAAMRKDSGWDHEYLGSE